VLNSSVFASLPTSQARAVAARRTLGVREVDVFSAVVNWLRGDLERAIADGENGEVIEI